MRTQIQKAQGSQVRAYELKANTKDKYDVLPTHIFIWMSSYLNILGSFQQESYQK